MSPPQGDELTMYELFAKRIFDVMVAVLALLLLAPLILIVALAIRLDDRGPAIFRQQRVGVRGAPFTIYKFRSMPVLTPNLPSAHASSLKVTRIGKILRRTNIDELPQLWNVLLGDMSLVGPRPALPSQVDLVLGRTQRRIDQLRPGLTGLAQVNGYNGMSDTQKLEWESRYANHISFLSDCAIVLRTFGYLMRPPPVY